MNDKELLKKLLDVEIKYWDSKLEQLAELMFRMETQHGLSPEITYDNLTSKYNLEKDQWLCVLSHYLGLATQHKIKSSIGEGRLKDLQSRNKRILIKFIIKGEFEL